MYGVIEDQLILNPHGLEVVKLDEHAKLPTKAHITDLGLDLYALEDTTLAPGDVTLVRTGIACNFPQGYGALIRDRSSVSTKQKVFVVAGVIDQGYTGEIKVAFHNPGQVRVRRVSNERTGTMRYQHASDRWEEVYDGPVQFKAGDKIAQMILTPIYNFPIVEVTNLKDTTRGAGGFGSSGK